MRRFAIVSLVLLGAGAAQAQDAFDLLKYIPPQANAVAVINTQFILGSPRAVKDGWAKLEHTEYLAGAVPLNPLIDRMIVAKDIKPDSPGSGGVIAVMTTAKPVELPKIAKLMNGTETKISDEPAVVNPNGTYFVKLGDKVLGAIRTESKQDVARWIKYTKTAKESQLHKTINSAVATSASHHIVLALDTDELFDEKHVDIAVAMTKSIQTSPEQVAAVADFFKGLKGVVLTASFTNDSISAKIRFESSKAGLKLDPNFAKTFIIETLDRHGAMLADLGTAKASKSQSNQSVILDFGLSDGELGRIMSLILPPAALPPADAIAIAPGAPNVAATVKYFNAVNKIVDDLIEQNKKANDYSKTAVWHVTAANKIEALSVIGVDPAAVEYAHGTCRRLEMIADSLRGVPAKVEELSGQAYAFGFVPRFGGRRFFNPWNTGGISTNVGDIINRQNKVVKDDEKNREKLWNEIAGKRSQTKNTITEKYGVVPDKK